MDKLRVTRVHFRDQYLFCLLSDGNIVCVPLAISATLKGARASSKYRWQIMDEGRTVAWYTGANGFATERLSLKRILAHPDAQIMKMSPA